MTWLGEALAVDILTRDDPGQEVGLLLWRAVHDDRRTDQPLTHAAHHPRHPGPVQLLVEDRDAYRVEPPAAELLRPVRADEPGVSQLAFPLGVEGVLGLLGPGEQDVVPVAPVGQLGKASRGMAGNPVPDFGAEFRDLRAKI